VRDLGPPYGDVTLHFYLFGGLVRTSEWAAEYRGGNGL
jgi:hypothetical protein